MNLADRVVESEWLDRLPAHDRLAVESRMDLRLINRIMGHSNILVRFLRGQGCRPWDLSELGAGDGLVTLKAIKCLAAEERPRSVLLVDRVPVVEADTLNAFAKLGCPALAISADAFDWLRSTPSTSVLSANLFLHHFPPPQLEELMVLIAKCCTTFIACEPRRSARAYCATRLLRLIGCNEVTRHDGRLSVRAGFMEQELTPLWPNREQWRIEERTIGMFSHLFVASQGMRQP